MARLDPDFKIPLDVNQTNNSRLAAGINPSAAQAFGLQKLLASWPSEERHESRQAASGIEGELEGRMLLLLWVFNVLFASTVYLQFDF
jgi:hypothetical protein